MKDKKNVLKLIIFSLVIVGSITYILISLGVFKEKRNNNIKPSVKEDTYIPLVNVTNKEDAYKFAGMYSNGTSTIVLYPLDSGRLFYTITGEIYFRGAANVTDSLAQARRKYDDKIDFEFTLKENGIDLKVLNESKMNDGFFQKIKDYTSKDFYLDNISKKDYINSKYNGLYLNENAELLIYQYDEKNLELIVTSNDQKLTYSNIFSINELKSDNDDILSINDNEVTINIKSSGFELLNGVFNNKKTITYEDIINKKYLDF